MNNNKNIINFGLDRYYALSENKTCSEDWQGWLNNSASQSALKVPVDHIPAMVRRRMSPLSKIAVQVALELIKKNEVDYIVFSSRHGELPRTVELIKSILTGDDASPMAFSQSVHNTAAGLTTIIAKQAIPVTSLAAGQDTFHQALIESYLYLNDNPEKKVLLVDFDAPLPSVYQRFENTDFETYAVGLILSSNSDYRLTWQPHINIDETVKCIDSQLPQSIDCFKHLLLSDTEWKQSSERTMWQWQKID